jgi:transposase
MRAIYPRCCGLDVHKKTVVACRLVLAEDGTCQQQVRTFGTMTEDLLALSDWLAEAGVTHVAMESTGVYWKPVYNLLEGNFELLLVNAQHVKHVPGRKTDVRDCEWLAELLQHGLLTASFVPERAQRELRELTRYRTAVIRERAAEVNRLQKTLEGANIKLGDVASDLQGRSATEMLIGLVTGQGSAAELAQRARGRMKEKIPELEKALTGQFGAHQRFLVARQLAHIDYLDHLLRDLDAQVKERLRPFQPVIERLDSIPGVARRSAEVLLAEIGTDMERFPTHKHLASWAGMCPGNRESAGKSKSGKTRKGSPWLRAALAEAAHAAARKKGSYLAAQYHRLAAKRRAGRAAVGVGHSILVIAYHLIKEGQEYREIGGNYFDERDRQAVIRRCVSRIEELGCRVNVDSLRAAA